MTRFLDWFRRPRVPRDHVSRHWTRGAWLRQGAWAGFLIVLDDTEALYVTGHDLTRRYKKEDFPENDWSFHPGSPIQRAP